MIGQRTEQQTFTKSVVKQDFTKAQGFVVVWSYLLDFRWTIGYLFVVWFSARTVSGQETVLRTHLMRGLSLLPSTRLDRWASGYKSEKILLSKAWGFLCDVVFSCWVFCLALTLPWFSAVFMSLHTSLQEVSGDVGSCLAPQIKNPEAYHDFLKFPGANPKFYYDFLPFAGKNPWIYHESR